MGMFDGGNELAAAVAAIKEVGKNTADVRQLVDRAIRMHLGDRVNATQFGPKSAVATVLAAQTKVMLTVTPPKGYAGICTGIVLDCGRWSDSLASANGLKAFVTRGTSPVFDLVDITSPFGAVGEPKQVWQPFSMAEGIGVTFVNLDAANPYPAFVQLFGFWYSATEGGRG